MMDQVSLMKKYPNVRQSNKKGRKEVFGNSLSQLISKDNYSFYLDDFVNHNQHEHYYWRLWSYLGQKLQPFRNNKKAPVTKIVMVFHVKDWVWYWLLGRYVHYSVFILKFSAENISRKSLQFCEEKLLLTGTHNSVNQTSVISYAKWIYGDILNQWG